MVFFRLVFILMISFSCAAAQAQSTSLQGKIEQMMELLEMETQVHNTVQQVQSNYIEQLNKLSLPEEYRSVLVDYQQGVFNVIRGAMGWDSQKQKFIDVYARSLPENVIDDVLVFLNTSSGKQFISGQRLAGDMVKQQLQPDIISMQQSIAALTTQFQNDLKKAQATSQ